MVFTIIPLKIFTSERGFAKLEIGLAQGKKIYDKRETLKDRDAEAGDEQGDETVELRIINYELRILNPIAIGTQLSTVNCQLSSNHHAFSPPAAQT